MSLRKTRLLPVTLLTAGVLAGAGCRLDVDSQAYIEREQKRFPVEGAMSAADLDLKTFSGRIEIISWDRPEVLVEIEKRGEDKDAVSKITVTSEQKESKISIDVRHPGRTSFGIGRFTSPSARLIVSVPRKCNITARSGDGSISLERVEGALDLRTDDGTIRVVESRGTLLAESNDGSMTLDDVTGHVEVRTNDGAVRVSGTPSVLRVRTSDGSVSLRIRDGAAMTDDWMVTTGDGSVTAELPKNFNAMIDADPGGGRVRSELMLSNVTGAGADTKRRDRGPMSGQLGSGGRLLTLRTGDGTIRLTNY